jgi:hypothetical protein
MKLSILTATALACLLFIPNLANAESPDRKNIKSVYGTNNSLPSPAEMRNISQAIGEYYRKRNERANPNHDRQLARAKYVVFEEVTDITLVELKMSPVTRSKVAKVDIHILERGYSCTSKQSAQQLSTNSPGAYQKFALNNNPNDKYLWKLDREQIIEGKLLIDRRDNNTWKVTGTAMAVITTKSIK